jgi:ureidoglycolate lyase
MPWTRRSALGVPATVLAAAAAGSLRGTAASAQTAALPPLPDSPFATHGKAPEQTVAVHTRRDLVVATVTPEAFAPFGTVLTEAGRQRLPINTYGDSLDLYRNDFESDQPIEWFIVRARPRELSVLFLERHMQLTQTFIPIDGNGFYTVVARPGATEDGAFPALDEVRAFYVPPGSAIQLHRGTWHENPLPAGAELRALVTSHAALTLAHQQNPAAELAGLPIDLERRWYRAGGFDLRLRTA